MNKNHILHLLLLKNKYNYRIQLKQQKKKKNLSKNQLVVDNNFYKKVISYKDKNPKKK